MTHLGQEAALGFILAGGPLGGLTRAVALFLEQVDAIGQADGQGDQFESDAGLDHRRAVQAEQLEAQRAGRDQDERGQQHAPGQRVVDAIAHAATPDEGAGGKQADRGGDHRDAGQDAPGLHVQQQPGNHAAEGDQQRAAQHQVEPWKELAGVQEVAAELNGDQAMAEHQDVDAHGHQPAVVGQPFDQQAVEGEREQPDVEGVDQIPEVRRLAQRGEEEQVVAEHREQHAVEGAADAAQLLLLGRAGVVAAEVQRHVERAGGLDAQQKGGFARRQIDGKPEVADLYRTIREGVAIPGQLPADAAVGVLQEQLDVVEQRVVDFDEAAERCVQIVDQSGA